MNAIDSFKKAAKDFQSDEVYQRYLEAKKANDADEGLQKDLGEFNLLRLNLNTEMEKQDKDEAVVNQLNTEIGTLYSRIMGNQNMQAYGEAKQGVESFIEYVNAVLNAALDGKDPMEVEEPHEGCDPSACASCGGGCGC